MMSQTSKRELVAELRPRYTLGSRTAKQRILDELVVVTGYHRKYAIWLLNHPPKRRTHSRRARKPKYGGRVRAALEQVWRVANCICGKRLVPVLAEFVAALERHGELKLDAETRRLLLCLSPATADRLLKRARQGLRPHGLGTTKPAACCCRRFRFAPLRSGMTPDPASWRWIWWPIAAPRPTAST